MFWAGILVKGVVGLGVLGMTATTGYFLGDELGLGVEGIKKLWEKSMDEKIRDYLGLNNTDCWWGNDREIVYRYCSLNTKDIRKINFADGAGNRVTANTDSAMANLVMEWLPENLSQEYPERLKFTLVNTDSNNSINIGEEGNRIELKRAEYVFKIKKHSEEKWSLEKVWNLKKLGEKVGLECEEGNEVQECTFKSKLNIWTDDDYITNVTFTGDQKIKITQGAEDHNEGYKLTVENDVSISNGVHNQDKEKIKTRKLTPESKRKTSYQIGVKRVWGGDKWFLIEKVEENNNKVHNQKIRLMNIEDEKCLMPNKIKKHSCELDKTKFIKLAFRHRNNDQTNNPVAYNDENGKITMTVHALEDYIEARDYTENMRITLKYNGKGEVKVPLTINNKAEDIVLKPGVENDFILYWYTNQYRLQKFHYLWNFARKAGLDCSDGKSCTITNFFRVNVWKGENEWKMFSKIPRNTKVKVQKDVPGYRNGFKFTFDNDIVLNEGKSGKKSIEKLKKNASYELDIKNTRTAGKDWFLVEKEDNNRQAQ